MTIITRYACDVCGTEYICEYGARQCEKSKPPRPSYEPGDPIIIESYEEGLKNHVVKSMRLEGFYPYGATYNEKELRELERIHKGDIKWHQWVIQLEDYEQISRDEWSDTVGIHSVIEKK